MILLLRRKIQLKKSAGAFYKSSQTIVSLLCNLLRLSRIVSFNFPRVFFEWSLYLQWFFHIEEDHGQKQQEKNIQNAHACFRKGEIDLSGFLALNVWRVSALLSPGSYVGAIEARWSRRCRRRAVKTRTLEVRIPVQFGSYAAWVPLTSITWVLA